MGAASPLLFPSLWAPQECEGYPSALRGRPRAKHMCVRCVHVCVHACACVCEYVCLYNCTLTHAHHKLRNAGGRASLLMPTFRARWMGAQGPWWQILVLSSHRGRAPGASMWLVGGQAP